MRNLYVSTTRPQVHASPLAGDAVADVAIVGGGYTGLSAALHLAQAGVDALVLEADEIGHGCSGRNGGQVNPGLKELPEDVVRRWGADLGARMNRMASDAPDHVFDLIERYGIDCEPKRTGTIRAAIDAEGERQVRALAEQSAAAGHPVTLADARTMRSLTGASVYRAGAHDMRGGHINPLAYARGLAVEAQRAGARLHPHSRVDHLQRSGTATRLTTAHGAVTARQVLICTNGYSSDLWPGHSRALVPVYTYITATDPLPAELRRSVMPSGAALYEAAWDVVYYRVDAQGRLVMGGRGPQRGARGGSDYRHLVDYAATLWPALRGIDFPWAWYGQVALTADHYPHFVEPEDGVRIMYGYNGRGIAVATAAGRMLAERILSDGRAEIDLPVRPALEPIRFHRFWRLGAETTMVWNRIKDGVRGR